MKKTSAGLLMYRIRNNTPEIFLVHPGGPYYRTKDEGVWSIPKGEMKGEETDALETAKREFEEETGFTPSGAFLPLGSTKSKSGKTVHAWAFAGDVDHKNLKSITLSIEWPPRSSKKIEIPEVDRGDFFSPEIAKTKVTPYQIALIESFERLFATISGPAQ